MASCTAHARSVVVCLLLVLGSCPPAFAGFNAVIGEAELLTARALVCR